MSEPIFAEYLERSERRSDLLVPQRVADLAAVLDCDFEQLAPHGQLPPLAHWLYFNRWVRQSELGPDGHPRRGSFLPPIGLPHRMYAGGRLQFLQPLDLGETAECRSTIVRIEEKAGSSGALVFLTVRHEITGSRGLAIVEEQDLVYRDAARSTGSHSNEAEVPGDVPSAFRRTICPDPVMLFRFSAVTSNGHRIHYDRRYVTEVEGYPGLVVHGPLQAMLLADMMRAHFPGRTIGKFAFRARGPIFDTERFECVAIPSTGGAELETRNEAGQLCMSATATLVV